MRLLSFLARPCLLSKYRAARPCDKSCVGCMQVAAGTLRFSTCRSFNNCFTGMTRRFKRCRPQHHSLQPTPGAPNENTVMDCRYHFPDRFVDVDRRTQTYFLISLPQSRNASRKGLCNDLSRMSDKSPLLAAGFFLLLTGMESVIDSLRSADRQINLPVAVAVASLQVSRPSLIQSLVVLRYRRYLQ